MIAPFLGGIRVSGGKSSTVPSRKAGLEEPEEKPLGPRKPLPARGSRGPQLGSATRFGFTAGERVATPNYTDQVCYRERVRMTQVWTHSKRCDKCELRHALFLYRKDANM